MEALRTHSPGCASRLRMQNWPRPPHKNKKEETP